MAEAVGWPAWRARILFVAGSMAAVRSLIYFALWIIAPQERR
jgi:phage shock protein PspC (stress-responsive transcriptional regulator)